MIRDLILATSALAVLVFTACSAQPGIDPPGVGDGDNTSPPTAVSIVIEPDVAHEEEALTAMVVAHSWDPDGDDVVYLLSWFRDEVEQPAYDGPTIPAGVTEEGETWKVVARPFDGLYTGPATSDRVLILGAAQGDDDSGDDDDDDDDDDGDDDTGAEPSILVDSDCGPATDHHFGPWPGGLAARMLSIYESDAPHETMGDVDVTVDLDHDVVLVVSSYEPVHWIVDEIGAGELQGILASGYYQQNVTAPPGVPVDIIYPSGTDFWAQGPQWTCESEQALVAEMEANIGMELDSYHGCYHTAFFTLEDGSGAPVPDTGPDCTQPGVAHGGPDTSVLAGVCPAETGEAYYCLTQTDDSVAVLGLETGSVCEFLPSTPLGYGTNSVVWLDQYLYSTAGSCNTLTRVDLTDGTTDEAMAWGESVGAWNGALLLEPSWATGSHFGSMWHYPTFRDAECDAAQVISVDLNNTRITVYGDTVYSAWHSTDTIDKLSLPSGSYAGSIPLENYDTWVNGMSVIDGELLVLSASWPEDRVAVFDVDTGLSLWDVTVSQRLDGLHCLSNP